MDEAELNLLKMHIDDMLMNGDMTDIAAANVVAPLWDVAIALTQKYDAVITNPPYMGATGMSSTLSEYVKAKYPDSKSDFFSCFIERGIEMLRTNGLESMITMESWMFLSSFEKLRAKINTHTIINMVHMPYLGKGGTSLGINFGTEMSIIQNKRVAGYNATYDRIAYYETDDDGIPFEFPVRNEYYRVAQQENFSRIPGAPVAYWASESMLSAFRNARRLKECGDTRQGMATSDNNRFLRFWYEVQHNKIGYGCATTELAKKSMKKWFPYNKGGAYRKWYGNLDYVINYENDG